jgi:hypothetical protein
MIGKLGTSILATAAATCLMGILSPTVASASASDAGIQSLASCAPHHLNTAYWATCTSGSTPSKVRVAGLCKQLIGGDVWRWSAWKTVPSGSSTPVRGECTRAVHGSKVEVQQL